ncbi:uncharacterized protein K441DRAFT_654842 [Cenococcum geophilum 1.58]|uniref:uncharacterized protein n=1 Tax=Cenococcum geophilum 1.58 TaxID=794803 RepID=UPI0035900847|nr:hypothetical protein K441DRAFT_654842 [Cenococcum geophilum 1.58]
MRPTGRGALLFVLLCWALSGLCRWVTALGCFYGLLVSSHPSPRHIPDAPAKAQPVALSSHPATHPHALAGRGG